jgi:putative phosphoesterase
MEDYMENSNLAIISDTHDEIHLLDTFFNHIADRNIHSLVHCGDFSSAELVDKTINLCKRYNINLYMVLGNDDMQNISEIEAVCLKYGRNLPSQFQQFRIGNIKIGVIHGDIESIRYYKFFLESDINLIINGHTHEVSVRIKNKTLIVNPGSLKNTYLIINPHTLKIEVGLMTNLFLS